VALQAAEQLASDGIDAEVIDPRTLAPLDMDTILESVAHTGKLVIVHEAVKTGGIGGEIAARVQEAAFSDLKAPIIRVGAPDTPVPAGEKLEKLFVPSQGDVIDAVKRAVG